MPLRVVQEVRSEAHLAGVRPKRRVSPSIRSKERALMQMREIGSITVAAHAPCQAG